MVRNNSEYVPPEDGDRIQSPKRRGTQDYGRKREINNFNQLFLKRKRRLFSPLFMAQYLGEAG
jgi:hypothetical protein